MARISAPALPIASISWMLDRPSQANVSPWDGTRRLMAEPWHGKWSASVELAPIVGEKNVRALRSFLARCLGSINTFRLYATEGPQNANSGVTAAAAAAQGAKTITLAGYATALLDGQFVTVNGQLVQLTADQAGAAITFEPPLRAPVALGTTIVTSRPYALVYMASQSGGWSAGPGQVYGIRFDVEEAVREDDGVAPEA